MDDLSGWIDLEGALKVRLKVFEGPLDLLLHLIKSSKIDIYDIPVAEITSQYLAYLDLMKELDLDLASEFLVMAATLAQIKSRMLLPVHEEGGEDEDPRQDLVRQLLEHQKYREASEALEERLRERSLLFSREPAANPPLKEEVFMDVTLFQLLQAFREIMSRAAEGQSLLIPPDQWSVADKMRDIMALLEQRPDLIFTQAFPPGAPRGEIIACFLAILELVKLQMIHLFQRESGGEIYLARSVA